MSQANKILLMILHDPRKDPRKERSGSGWFHGSPFLWQMEALWPNKDVELEREAKSSSIQIVDDVLANTERCESQAGPSGNTFLGICCCTRKIA